jgi:UDP-N-acetylmuramoyl-L-alanyl-D-glutamate--2,6-diaminopimelate ligase
MKKLLKKLIPETSPQRLVFHRFKAFVAALCYGFPARKLTVIGITGTDGKTTTVGMIAHILNRSGKKCGALSTAFFQIGNDVTWNPTQKTSPSPFMVQKFLRECVEAGCTHVVLECSSHGLLQGRVSFTWPMVAGITNISEEHLDYHGTMDKYLRAKSILFRSLRKHAGVAVLNADDRSFEMLRSIKSPWNIDYSTEKKFEAPENDNTCALWITEMNAQVGEVRANLHCNTEGATYLLQMPIAGAFNLTNALCAIGCTHALNVSLSDCVSSLRSFKGIPGRMEQIDIGQDFSVYIDFTVTPQSYEATLSTLKSSLREGGRLLVLTGSCGDRMKEKRPLIGKIVSTYADIMVVANEDPYTEDPENIIDDVWAGIDQSRTEAHRIFDRHEAIRFLLQKEQTNDTVIFCGKGSDTTMWVKTGQIPWNEREIVKEELGRLGGKEK